MRVLLLILGLAAAGCIGRPTEAEIPVRSATPCLGENCPGVGGGSPSPLPAGPTAPPSAAPVSTGLPASTPSAETAATLEPPAAAPAPAKTALPSGKVPFFSHVIVIVLENREFGSVIGNTGAMPEFHRWVENSTLLTQYYAVTHPSLPNYIAMIAGDTLGIDSNCEDCFVDAPSLPDLIEASGRSWRTYQEDLPSPCFIGSKGEYAQKHNPFVYFDAIRLNEARCQNTVVPLDWMYVDLTTGTFPDFAFIVPNLCNSGHDCDLDVVDSWLGALLETIQISPKYDQNSLIVVTYDEGQGSRSCCGLEAEAGGRVATLLISPLVKSGFLDDTPYSHYSLLKTIAASWGLEELGHAADPETNLIEAPWKAP